MAGASPPPAMHPGFSRPELAMRILPRLQPGDTEFGNCPDKVRP